MKSIQLGSTRLVDIDFDVMSMVDMPPVFGTVVIDGILGRPVFDRYTVQVDYDQHLLLLLAPGSFRPKASDTPASFTRVRDVPLIKASLDGHDGMFGIDPGARSSLLVNGWFAEGSHLRISGHRVSEIRLADVRDEWAKESNGTRISFEIKRGDVVLEKTLQLKSLV
jgi:hypothetical protein